MKKLLFLLIPFIVYGADTTGVWSSASSTDLNNVSNWTWSPSAPSEISSNCILQYDTASTGKNTNSTATATISCKSITATVRYKGNISWSGYTLICATDASFDHSGTLNCGNRITSNGNSGTVHIGAVGTVTASNCVLTMNGTTGMIFDDDKGISLKSLTLGASAVLTISGASSTTFISSTTCLTLGNSSSIVFNTITYFDPTATQTVFSIGTGVSMTGTASIIIEPTTNSGTTITVPAITFTTGTYLAIKPNVACTIDMAGNISVRGFSVYTTAAGANFTFNTNGYSITNQTSGVITIGSLSATAAITVNCGSSTVSCLGLDGASLNTGNISFNMGSSQWTCSGNWAFGSKYTVDAGTSRIIKTGASASVFNTANKKIYTYVNKKNTGVLDSLADSLRCAFYYDSTGKFKQKTKGIVCDSSYQNVSADSAFMDADVYIGKNYLRTNQLVTRTAGAFYFDTVAGYQHLFNSTGYQVGPVYGKKFTFQDSAKIQKLTLQGDSCICIFTSGKGVRIDTVGGDLNGATGKLNYYSSSSVARLYFPAAQSVSYTKWTNINSVGFVVTAAECAANGGGDINFVFPDGCSTTTKKSYFRFGLGWGW